MMFLNFKWDNWYLRRHLTKPKRPWKASDAVEFFVKFYLVTVLVILAPCAYLFLREQSFPKDCALQDAHADACVADSYNASARTCALKIDSKYYKYFKKKNLGYPRAVCEVADAAAADDDDNRDDNRDDDGDDGDDGGNATANATARRLLRSLLSNATAASTNATAAPTAAPSSTAAPSAAMASSSRLASHDGACGPFHQTRAAPWRAGIGELVYERAPMAVGYLYETLFSHALAVWCIATGLFVVVLFRVNSVTVLARVSSERERTFRAELASQQASTRAQQRELRKLKLKLGSAGDRSDGDSDDERAPAFA